LNRSAAILIGVVHKGSVDRAANGFRFDARYPEAGLISPEVSKKSLIRNSDLRLLMNLPSLFSQ
jgi:hypothetical protein